MILEEYSVVADFQHSLHIVNNLVNMHLFMKFAAVAALAISTASAQDLSGLPACAVCRLRPFSYTIALLMRVHRKLQQFLP